MSAAERTKAGSTLPPRVKRGMWIAAAIVVVLLGVAFGTKVVASDDPLAQGTQGFDPVTFGADHFPEVQSGVIEQAVGAAELSAAIAADSDAAAAEHGMASSGGPVYSVTFTGIVEEGSSGIYSIDVVGVPDDLLIRVQMGPAINGTELRDATGEIQFGQFRNQIDYQNAAVALNEELKAQVLEGIDTMDLEGATVTVTGAFTLVNPSAWLVTPVEVSVQ